MKLFNPKKNLRLRLVAWYGLLTGLSMTIFYSLIYLEFRQALLAQVDATLEVTTIQALKNLDDEVDLLKFDPRQDAPFLVSLLNDAGIEIYLLNQNGAITENFGTSLIQSPQKKLKDGFETVQTQKGRWRLYIQKIPHRDDRPSGWLKIAHSLNGVDATSNDLLTRYILKIPLILGLVGLCGLFLANRALSPIQKITKMVESVIASGDLTQRIHYAGPTEDELSHLAALFDEMLDSLQETFEREQRFTADASHELRTPLAALKGRLNVALSQPRTVNAYQETLQSIEHEVERLIRLSRDLLLLSRLEQDHQDISHELIDLSDLLEAISEQIRPLADLKHVTFVSSLVPGLKILGSPDQLIRLFLNLLDNAVKYTPEQGRVELSASLQAQSVQVVISDTGLGIAPEHLPHLFERFYRVEKSRSRPIAGSGLGLAIAQEIATCHHGSITVQSELAKGTTFRVSLPRVVAES